MENKTSKKTFVTCFILTVPADGPAPNYPWWHHQKENFPRYWWFVRGIHRSPVNSTHKRPVTQSFDVFFDQCLNIRLSKQSSGWWFETPSCPLWCHCNAQCVFGVGVGWWHWNQYYFIIKLWWLNDEFRLLGLARITHLKQLFQGSFCICAHPMRYDVTL